MEPKTLTEPETSVYIKMSRSYLRQARCAGQVGHRTRGPAFIKIGRSVRYLVEDLDAWLEEHRQG